jgi:cytosine/creatinine deaminase
VSAASRRALGLAAAGVEVGAAADLVAIRATSLREAIAMGPTGRVVLKAGGIVSGAL